MLPSAAKKKACARKPAAAPREGPEQTSPRTTARFGPPFPQGSFSESELLRREVAVRKLEMKPFGFPTPSLRIAQRGCGSRLWALAVKRPRPRAGSAGARRGVSRYSIHGTAGGGSGRTPGQVIGAAGGSTKWGSWLMNMELLSSRELCPAPQPSALVRAELQREGMLVNPLTWG